MHWMNLEELNIFVLLTVILFSIMLVIVAASLCSQLDDAKARINRLEKETDTLKTELNKYIKG